MELQGKYGKAIVMLETLEDKNTISQIYQFLNHPAFTKPIRIMPDCHYGAGAVIGFTMEMTDMIIPNIVGVDINCGMLLLYLGKNILSEISREEIDKIVKDRIPFGPNVHPHIHLGESLLDHNFWEYVNISLKKFATYFNEKYLTSFEPISCNMDWLERKCKEINMDFNRTIASLATLGGGNHFIELGKLQNTNSYTATIHTGSRQFGQRIATHWQRKAGKGDLAYLTGEDMFGYLMDMVFAQEYATLNREGIGYIIEDILGKKADQEIETCHNFIDFRDFIIRKGAISAYEEELSVIPFNMEDGLLICEGKGNSEWNFSAPHGAGRISSRSKIKKKMKEISSAKLVQERMLDKGIYTSHVPLDETKEAYKDPKIIEDAIGPTVKIIDRSIPILNMKG